RRHTRSKRDWSSDVCSSDLDRDHVEFYPGRSLHEHVHRTAIAEQTNRSELVHLRWEPERFTDHTYKALTMKKSGPATQSHRVDRSEERRVGKGRRSKKRRKE